MSGGRIGDVVGRHHRADTLPMGRMGIRLKGPAHAPRGSVKLYWRTENERRWKLKSADPDWVIVTSEKIYVSGSGEVNGKPGYRFLVALETGAGYGDGQDVALKVWEVESGAVLVSTEETMHRPGRVWVRELGQDSVRRHVHDEKATFFKRSRHR